MTCTLGVVAVLILGLLTLGFAIQFGMHFFAYSGAVAKLQERQAEWSTPFGRDEGGLNKFDQEMFWDLLSGDYRKHGSAEVSGHGSRAAKAHWRCLAALAGFAVALWWVNSAVCA